MYIYAIYVYMYLGIKNLFIHPLYLSPLLCFSTLKFIN